MSYCSYVEGVEVSNDTALVMWGTLEAGETQGQNADENADTRECFPHRKSGPAHPRDAEGATLIVGWYVGTEFEYRDGAGNVIRTQRESRKDGYSGYYPTEEAAENPLRQIMSGPLENA